MPKKAAKKTQKRSRKPAKAKKATQEQQTSVPAAPEDAASQRFQKDLLIRGEAAELDKQGKLPLRATHVIKRKKPDGTAEVERVRYKAF